jgi:hypothetical protein
LFGAVKFAGLFRSRATISFFSSFCYFFHRKTKPNIDSIENGEKANSFLEQKYVLQAIKIN